jgi:hypothetical protein
MPLAHLTLVTWDVQASADFFAMTRVRSAVSPGGES